ncbi:MAG: AbrB/MazE/SpoVT family DNA-binding domain-containing protein [Methylococcales bacterium]
MLAKLTSKNQLTLPKSVVTSVGKADYYDVVVKSGRIILTPVRIQQADAVRAKLDALGINEQDMLDAIQWARQPPPA